MLYDIAFLLFSLFYIPTLVFKGKLHRDFVERFGIYGDAKEDALWKARDVIWIQAVSVGEVTLCKSLIPELKTKFPLRSIVLSTITRTGNDLAKKLFSNDAIVIYFPLDFSATAKGAISKIKPKLYVMIETEIWPNVLKELGRKRVPSILINGRISDRSFGKYKIVKSFLAKTLDMVSMFCMQSEADANRIRELGAKPDRVIVTGNMKFDTDAIINRNTALPGLFGLSSKDRIFVAGSTHGGEEEAVVSAYKDLLNDFPELKLIIAPRHVERSSEVESVLKRFGFDAVMMSRASEKPARDTPPGHSANRSAYIIDKIGHLNDAYAMAEIVFIGGSLVPHGGQNPIEPAAFEKPVLFGPYMFNFKTVASALLENKGAIQVRDGKELLLKAEQLLKDTGSGISLGLNAKATILKNRGASQRNLKAIEGFVHD